MADLERNVSAELNAKGGDQLLDHPVPPTCPGCHRPMPEGVIPPQETPFDLIGENARLRRTLCEIIQEIPANQGGTQGAIRKHAKAALDATPAAGGDIRDSESESVSRQRGTCDAERPSSPAEGSAAEAASNDVPAYADPTFRYDEKTMSYHRIKPEVQLPAEAQVCCYCDHALSRAQCGREQPALDVPSVAPTEPTREALVDSIAKWLHEETEHPDSYPSHTWPETDRDDGRREGGWVKIVPQHAQAYFRDIARRLIARFPAALAHPASAAQQNEPVRYQFWWEQAKQWADLADDEVESAKQEGQKIRALYAAPPAPSSGVREALEEAKLFLESVMLGHQRTRNYAQAAEWRSVITKVDNALAALSPSPSPSASPSRQGEEG